MRLINLLINNTGFIFYFTILMVLIMSEINPHALIWVKP